MKKFLYLMVQCTWGVLQNLLGAIIFLVLIKNKHYIYRGAVVTEWSNTSSASIGMFIFMTAPKHLPKRCSRQEVYRRLLVHEYGHTIQSLMLGPLYLPVIALPSAVWCNFPACKRYRSRKKMSYYSFYTERWADRLGEQVTGRRSMGC